MRKLQVRFQPFRMARRPNPDGLWAIRTSDHRQNAEDDQVPEHVLAIDRRSRILQILEVLTNIDDFLFTDFFHRLLSLPDRGYAAKDGKQYDYHKESYRASLCYPKCALALGNLCIARAVADIAERTPGLRFMRGPDLNATA